MENQVEKTVSIIKDNKANGRKGFAFLSPEERQAISRKGGLAVSQNRQHMAEIGRKGGEVAKEAGNKGFAGMEPDKQKELASKGGQSISKNKDHMSEIGRKGGTAKGDNAYLARTGQQRPRRSE